jgi:phage repressor protein C with HTH and peptisase S24 domain
MQPAYRDGTAIVVSPAAAIRRGDRVVVKTRDGEVMAKELKRRTAKSIELRSLNPPHAERTLAVDDVLWIARIMWASQYACPKGNRSDKTMRKARADASITPRAR